MADSKISALPASTTPLAGTEVLPIVQSSTTRQVSVDNLTAGRAISATQLTLTTGNLIVASGQGIDFSATAGTGTSELFNDYEEGTFTPTILFGSSGTGITYSTQIGRYTKIGRQVTIEGQIILTSKGSATGFMTLNGLPFTINASSSPVQTIDTISAWNLLTIGGCLFFVAQQSTSYGYIMVQGISNRGTIDQTYFNNTTNFAFNFTYTV